MAIPHFRATFIGSTKSPIAAAAYRTHATWMKDVQANDIAKAAGAMNVVEAALRVQDQGRALVNAQDSQALALAKTQTPSQSI
jgi:hypothetical protein